MCKTETTGWFLFIYLFKKLFCFVCFLRFIILPNGFFFLHHVFLATTGLHSVYWRAQWRKNIERGRRQPSLIFALGKKE